MQAPCLDKLGTLIKVQKSPLSGAFWGFGVSLKESPKASLRKLETQLLTLNRNNVADITYLRRTTTVRLRCYLTACRPITTSLHPLI